MMSSVNKSTTRARHDMEKKSLEKRLLSVKKELKCWESMFERKHGRKPSKVDIEESPAEVKDTYRQYKNLKMRICFGGSDLEAVSDGHIKTSNTNGEKDEVFGSFLNKKPKKETVLKDKSQQEPEKHATWKLRRWTKGGYKTVVMNSDEEKCGENETPNGEESELDSTLTQLKETQSQTNATDEHKEIFKPIQFEDLTSKFSTKLVGNSDSDDSECPKALNLAGGYHTSFMSSGRDRRLKFSRGVSNKWLERCKPDLKGIGTSGEDSGEYRPTPVTDVMESQSNSVGSADVLSTGVDDEYCDEMRNDSFSDSDSSGEVPSIMTFSQEQKWEELSQSMMSKTHNDSEILDHNETPPQPTPASSIVDIVDSPALQHQQKPSKLDIKPEVSMSSVSVFDIIDSPASHQKQTLSKPDVKSEVSMPLISESFSQKKSKSSFYSANLSSAKQSTNTSRQLPNSKSTYSVSTKFETSMISKTADEVTTKPTLSSKGASSQSRSKDDDDEEIVFEEELQDEQRVGSDSDTPKNMPAAKYNKPRPSAASTTRSSTNVSENFVRLNMKMKRFSRRPGRALSGSAYKRQAWKKNQKMRGGGSGGFGGGKGGGRNVCFKCGKPGHWAKNCTDNGGSKNLGSFAGEKVKFCEEMALGVGEEMDRDTLEKLALNSPFPTVKDAAMMATGVKFDKIIEKKKSENDTNSGSENDDEGDDAEIVDGLKLSKPKKSSGYVAPPPCPAPSSTPPPPSIDPLYPPIDGKITATPHSVYAALKKFGYSAFRPGQEEAVMRILSGISTIVIHSTGSGKSLCYQLPAYLYSQSRSPCVTLVISPLVSLMEDQVRNFPPCLRGACLHTNQTQAQREKVLCDVVEGRVDVLLLSPEALVGGALWSRRGGSAYSLKQLPPVAFACIDEVHCVSEWSHNFRPSYLRIYKVLQQRLGVHCLLGLTATATHTTALSVGQHLCVDEENIIRGPMLPDNLHISVSSDQNRDQALVELLKSPKFRECESIIVYCTRQQQTERVAQLLRTCLQSSSGWSGAMEPMEYDDIEDNDGTVSKTTKSRKRKNASNSRSQSAKKRKLDWTAESYHAGMTASRRKKVQNDFMTGRLRIVVATVAFGMGLNKADVRAIVHYNMPKSFESFVQEIGRAGRDGLPAYCHVFIDKEGKDLSELRRHAYSNTVDPYAIKHLIRKTFPTCQCKDQKQLPLHTNDLTSSDPSHSPPKLVAPRWCAGHEVTIPIEATVQKLDVKEECISTLLCYMELQGWLEVINTVNDVCTLKCYGGPRQLRALAQKVPAVAAAAARTREKGTDLDHTGNLSFSVVEIADSMGWESHIVKSELADLQYNDHGTSGTSGGPNSTVLVEFDTLSFHTRSPGDLTPDERDYVCQFLCNRTKNQEEREVEKLHLLHASLQSVACSNYYECFEPVFALEEDSVSSMASGESEKMCRLKELIRKYFSNEGLNSDHLKTLGISVLSTNSQISDEQREQVERDIHSLLAIHSDSDFTGRSIARIFHGIMSPCFPAEVWGRQLRYWRRYLDVDFNLLCRISTRKLLELR